MGSYIYYIIITSTYSDIQYRKYIMQKLKCTRCGHGWYPRTPESPKKCPKCNSPYWNTPRRTSNPAPIQLGPIISHNCTGLCGEEYCSQPETHFVKFDLYGMSFYLPLCKKHHDELADEVICIKCYDKDT